MSTKGVQIEWKDVTVTVTVNKQEKKILDNITGNATAGQLLAIMGSSGAGKTTFMNVLTKVHKTEPKKFFLSEKF